MDTTRLPADHCPVCQHRIDAHTGAEPDAVAPGPGDFSMCAYCFSFLRYKDDLKLEHFPDERLLEMSDENRLMLVRARHRFQHKRYTPSVN